MPDEFAIYECVSCDNYILATAAESEMTCCGARPRRIENEGAQIEQPDTKSLFRQVFGMTETEMNICLCVIDEGEATANDISEALDIERSVVSRYANHLVKVGFLHKNERNLREGGRVHVYTHAEPEEVKRSLTLGFYRWAVLATEVIGEFEREKIKHMAPDARVEGEQVYWE